MACEDWTHTFFFHFLILIVILILLFQTNNWEDQNWIGGLWLQIFFPIMLSRNPMHHLKTEFLSGL